MDNYSIYEIFYEPQTKLYRVRKRHQENHQWVFMDDEPLEYDEALELFSKLYEEEHKPKPKPKFPHKIPDHIPEKLIREMRAKCRGDYDWSDYLND